jgi:hypothetical protein
MIIDLFIEFHSVEISGTKVECTHPDCGLSEYFPSVEDAEYAKDIHENYRREEHAAED